MEEVGPEDEMQRRCSTEVMLEAVQNPVAKCIPFG
jgi:hypothetical protein